MTCVIILKRLTQIVPYYTLITYNLYRYTFNVDEEAYEDGVSSPGDTFFFSRKAIGSRDLLNVSRVPQRGKCIIERWLGQAEILISHSFSI